MGSLDRANLDHIGSSALRFWRLGVYLLWTVPLMPVQAVGLALRRRWVVTFPRLYHRCCRRILGIEVRVIGQPATARPVLFAANHISYLDITVLGSLLDASFIAKTEIASWPLFGWLARLQRSVFIDRRARSTARQRDSIAARLAAGEALILFPEGTSGDGNRLLPFKSALFSVADHIAGPGAIHRGAIHGGAIHRGAIHRGAIHGGAGAVTVQPVSIAYTRLDGMPLGRGLRPFIAWYGSMSLAPHLWRMLGLGRLEVVVEFHSPTTLAACGSRKNLARYCEERVAEGLAGALSGRREAPERDGPLPEQRLPVAA
ncbi:MAG: lysophospholipid acyltransferase family protein [Alphaproteobacteria bacterium]